MKLLATIKSTDVNSNAKTGDYSSFKPRNAARVILLDGSKVALIHVSTHNYYMLPGGGIDGDDLITGLKREIKEEIGCDIEVLEEVGKTVLYFDRWETAQTDFCYVANKASSGSEASITEFELAEGHKVVWAKDLSEAVKLIRESEPKEDDGKIVKARDLLFVTSYLNTDS